MSKQSYVDKLSASIVFAQCTLIFMESIQHTKFYRHRLKQLLKPAITELIKAEEQEYDLIWTESPKKVDEMSSNTMKIIKLISMNGFTDFILLGNIILAYYKNPNAITGIANKILNTKAPSNGKAN